MVELSAIWNVNIAGGNWESRGFPALSEELGITQNVISRLWKRFQDNDFMSRRYSTGRLQVTTTNEDLYLEAIAKRNKRSTVSDLSR
ncbi:HTH_Tnp_Tc3_2 domain-containing protein [Trichonephila clavipes]|nr:HTH_Tnp_Tc3_2 domain-containing protein [Trichonephila clavipes]